MSILKRSESEVTESEVTESEVTESEVTEEINNYYVNIV